MSLGEGWCSASRDAGVGTLGEAREGSGYLHHSLNPAGCQGDISEFAESHDGLGQAEGQAPSQVEY